MNNNECSIAEEVNNVCIKQETSHFVHNGICFTIGWNGLNIIEDDGKSIIFECQRSCGDFVKIDINMDINMIKFFEKDNINNDWIEFEDCIGNLDLSNKGDRWEGSCRNGVPFGYGCIFDENNRVSYKGYLVDGKKVCFGEEYYDNGVIRYRGTFMNHMKHGYGCLYDMGGHLLYEGKWAFDQNDFFDVVVPDGCDDDVQIHNLVRDLVIGDDCFDELKVLTVEKYESLHVFRVGSDSFQNVETFVLNHCSQLEILDIGNESLKNTTTLTLQSTI